MTGISIVLAAQKNMNSGSDKCARLRRRECDEEAHKTEWDLLKVAVAFCFYKLGVDCAAKEEEELYISSASWAKD